MSGAVRAMGAEVDDSVRAQARDEVAGGGAGQEVEEPEAVVAEVEDVQSADTEPRDKRANVVLLVGGS